MDLLFLEYNLLCPTLFCHSKIRPRNEIQEIEGWPCTRESNSEFNRESLNFQHSLCLDNVTQRSNRQAQEKIPCYGEFTQRSDPWAGLIASCGSFYPMVHHSAAHSLDTSLTCGTSLWLIFGCPDYFLRNGVHISAGPEEVNRKELASVKPSARKWEWEKRRPENQPSNSGSTVHQIKS